MTGFAFNGSNGVSEQAVKTSVRDSIHSKSSGDNSDFEVTGALLSSESAHGTPRSTRSRSNSGGRAQLIQQQAGGSTTAAAGNTIVKPQFTDGVASVDGNSTFSLSKVRISSTNICNVQYEIIFLGNFAVLLNHNSLKLFKFVLFMPFY